jgi:hypothetical protein
MFLGIKVSIKNLVKIKCVSMIVVVFCQKYVKVLIVFHFTFLILIKKKVVF